ncbi:MAG: DUF565 domain-containing protein [Arthrospira sp. PLM2.Bin9]|nr:DUF565 domain-containing protein [Arthrospira sp. PLM2.Bin9]TVU52987.1 MAG: DUF565 domain-containing protein [Arthrospira sp. PLM2.Bin9]
MQNTRLNRFTDAIAQQTLQWFRNPWRRISVLLISLFFGFFLGVAIATIVGQVGSWDVSVAFITLLVTEWISWLSYRKVPRSEINSLGLDLLNSMKIGMTYSLFLLAFLLGS